MSFNFETVVTCLGTGVTVIGLVYTFLRNFKNDINSRIDKLETRMDILDERMFFLATGKKLEDAILAEGIKKNKIKNSKEK